MKPQAVIFDLGGTLVDWPDWEQDVARRWELAYGHLVRTAPQIGWPSAVPFVQAMRAAEAEHWHRVVTDRRAEPPATLLADGMQRLHLDVGPDELLAALDGYARAVDGWAVAVPDARATLERLRASGLRLGLLSNTWWAAAWHDADLAAHGLAELLDTVVYTSDLAYSKPHPAVFHEVAARLDVRPEACVMVGDRIVDDVGGALGAGMRGIWKRHSKPWPRPADIVPSAIVDSLAELPQLIETWHIQEA